MRYRLQGQTVHQQNHLLLLNHWRFLPILKAARCPTENITWGRPVPHNGSRSLKLLPSSGQHDSELEFLYLEVTTKRYNTRNPIPKIQVHSFPRWEFRALPDSSSVSLTCYWPSFPGESGLHSVPLGHCSIFCRLAFRRAIFPPFLFSDDLADFFFPVSPIIGLTSI